MARQNFLQRYPQFLLWCFLTFYFLFSLLTFRHYGMTWDEPAIYRSGPMYWNYYFQPWLVDNLSTVEDATHNYIYGGLLCLFCKPGNYTGIHLLNLIFTSLIFVTVYQLFYAFYRKPFWALTGCLFLFFTPRFIGDVPNDPKDAPFATVYFIALASIFLVPRWVKGWGAQAFWIGSLIGLASCFRILGLTLLPIYLLFQLIGHFQARGEGMPWDRWLIRQVPQWLLVGLFCQFWMMMLWPYLDHDFFNGLMTIFKESRFYYWDGIILYRGKLIHPSDHFLSYLPLWELITTPVFLLVSCLFSVLVFKRSTEVFLGWVLLGLALVFNGALYLALKPMIYNGLRHYLFLTPILSAIAAMGFIELCRVSWDRWVKIASFAFLSVSFIWTLVQCAQIYPYHYIYFNELAGGLKGAYGQYEMDYFGASLKEAAQWLKAQEPTRPIKVWISASIEQTEYYFGPNMKAFLKNENCDYWIALNKEAEFQMTPTLQTKVVHQVERQGVPLAYVLKLK